MKEAVMKCLLSISVINAVLVCITCLEKEATVYVDPGKQDCYYQRVTTGQVIDIEYQVIDGGHGDLDISFHLIDPVGRILNADFKKSENNHRVTAQMDGDYRFCFDNTFSSYNSKTVFFEIIVERDDGSDEDYDNGKVEGFRQEEVYELTVQEIQEVIGKVRNHITKVRQLQDIIKSTEARDRNTAEENYFKVNSYSMFQIVVMVLVGFVQVIMVRSLFDDRSKVHKIWKGLDGKR